MSPYGFSFYGEAIEHSFNLWSKTCVDQVHITFDMNAQLKQLTIQEKRPLDAITSTGSNNNKKLSLCQMITPNHSTMKNLKHAQTTLEIKFFKH